MRLPVSEYSLETNVKNAIDVVIGQEQSSTILTFLRDNIYDNPRKALVKELLSNSIDAHVENNVTRPIEITLPNAFSNLLVIRDFGTGLSPEFMSTKYTLVGFSTRSEENTSLGGYGLGRLSPLAYTDVYYIDSYYNNVLNKYMLTVYDEGNKKKVSLLNMGEFVSDEPSGFKVSIPIKEEDYSTIDSIVRDHCKYLHSQPPLINGEPAKLVTKVLESKDGDWYITYAFEGCIVGLIGGMPNKLKSISEYAKCHSNENYSYNKLGLVINIPIGSVTQTASKDIQKTKTTETTLTKLFNKVKSELITTYQNKLDTIDNLVEAIQLVAPLNSNIRFTLNWKSINLAPYYGVDVKQCDISKVKSSNNKNKKYYFDDCGNYIPVSEYLKVFINDLTNENQKILAEKLYHKFPGSLYIISDIKEENFNDLYNFPLLSSVISREELVEPPKPKKQPSTTVKKKVNTSCVTAYELRYDPSLQTYCSTNKVRVPKEPDRTEYYIELTDSNKRLVCNNAYYNNQVQHTPIYLFESLNKLNLDVWVGFNVYLKQKIDSLLKKTPKLLEFIDLSENHSHLWEVLQCFKDIDDCDLKDLYLEINSIKLNKYTLNSEEVNLLQLETYNQVVLNEIKLSNSLLTEYHKLETKYPLIFKHYSRDKELYNVSENRLKATKLTLEEVNNYITLINK